MPESGTGFPGVTAGGFGFEGGFGLAGWAGLFLGFLGGIGAPYADSLLNSLRW